MDTHTHTHTYSGVEPAYKHQSADIIKLIGPNGPATPNTKQLPLKSKFDSKLFWDSKRQDFFYKGNLSSRLTNPFDDL